MEDVSISSYRRSQWSLRSLIQRTWILTLCWVPGALSSCYGVNITVSMYPENDIAIKYGNPLEIFCTAEKYSSDDIEFTVLGVALESERINETTRRLYIENPKKQISVYYCKNKITLKSCVKRVVVESPPADITDFNCKSKNIEELNCSWSNPQSYADTYSLVTFSRNGVPVQPHCIANSTRFTCYRVWSRDSTPKYRLLDETLDFLVTSCNVFGCNNQTFSVDHCSIVKPDPPRNLEIIKTEPHSAVLRWKVPVNIYELLSCELEHIIEYRIHEIDNATNVHRIDSSSLPSRNLTYQFKLNLPYANMKYEARVYIKVKKAKSDYISDFSYIIFDTASERPQRPPEMIAGAFDQALFNERRIIYVYWKQLEDYEQAVDSFTYKVIYQQGNRTFPTVFADREKSLSYAVLTDVSLEALDVYVWSSNINGSSETSSHMYIPSGRSNAHTLHVTGFTKLAYDNGTYHLFWDGNENVDNYTLFWCRESVSRLCTGRVDFAVLDGGKKNHIIDLPKEYRYQFELPAYEWKYVQILDIPEQYRYQFAISANKGASTTGMVWTSCDISRLTRGTEMYKTITWFHYDRSTKSSVRLTWTVNCGLKNGIISRYKISYCLISIAKGVCDESAENKHAYIIDPKQMNIVIEDLRSFSTYLFTTKISL